MTSPGTELDPARLIDLLTQQRDLYQSLRELSQKQRQLISGDRPELLLTILRDRQDLVSSLARLNEDLGPYRRNWDAMYASLPDEQRETAAAILHEINDLLRLILRTDQEDGALLSARKQSVGSELSSTTGGQTANAAYNQQSTGKPRSAADLTG